MFIQLIKVLLSSSASNALQLGSHRQNNYRILGSNFWISVPTNPPGCRDLRTSVPLWGRDKASSERYPHTEQLMSTLHNENFRNCSKNSCRDEQHLEGWVWVHRPLEELIGAGPSGARKRPLVTRLKKSTSLDSHHEDIRKMELSQDYLMSR